MINRFDLISQSVSLDIQLLRVNNLAFSNKLKLFIKKYLYFLSRILRLNNQNKGSFLGQTVYFPNSFGYVGLQRVITSNDYIIQHLPKNISVLDIGAHAGEFAFFAKNFLKANKIVSIEPYKKVFEILNKNNPYNENINTAISSTNKHKLYISSISSQLNSLNKDTSRSQVQEVDVQTTKLEELKIDFNFDLLKIDTEGSEIDVLESGISILNNFKFILIEAEVPGNFTKLVKLVSDAGFKTIAVGNYHQSDRSIDLVFTKY